MGSPKSLLAICMENEQEQNVLLSRATKALSMWANWLQPVSPENDVGDELTYDDYFQQMRDEINKLSGTDPHLLCDLAERSLKRTKDIRVVCWYTLARLYLEGEKGLAEGLLLLVAMLSRFGQRCHPQRPLARKTAFEWLNSDKVLDALSLWSATNRDDTQLIVGALNLLVNVIAEWPENDRPSFVRLCVVLQTRLLGADEIAVQVPQDNSPLQEKRDVFVSSSSLAAVESERDLLEQAKCLARWLEEQPQGWLAAHRLMKSVRWDTINQLPPQNSNHQTRLLPPKQAYRLQLKRLYLQQNWLELITQASHVYCEGVNHFWLDLQWYLWQGLQHAGLSWQIGSDAVLWDLRLFLQRLPGLERLVWNDGTPFADEVTRHWITEKVIEKAPLFSNQPISVINNQTEDILQFESEAMAKGHHDGPDAALAWLQTRLPSETPRQRWLIRLLMARVAEHYACHDMALYLLGELIQSASELTIGDWEPALLFEVQARRLVLLRSQSGSHEGDMANLHVEMDTLLAALIAIDPAGAMGFCR